ncbi:MAG: hypothetical protein CMJ35_12940 [Phycisphaerae bacterium]|nr:hypothetical protein [Phycisphaerae bacterium]MBM92500.1 hypothetical protein [Phycisphaerae bacterium]
MNTSTIAALTLCSIAGASTHAAERDFLFINIIGSSDIIMMVNTCDEPLSLDGWRICTQNSTSGPVMSAPGALDGIVLEPNGSFLIRYDNDALPSFPSHHNASDIGPLASFELDAYAMSFYFPDDQGQVDFDNPDQMSDHIQWKRNFVGDDFAAHTSQVAQDAGLWFDASEWIYVRVHTYLIENQDRDFGQMHSPDDYNVIFECRADLSDDGLLDFFDVSAFLNAYIAQDPIADTTRDGNWDFFDVSTFLNQYSIGQCPSF